MSHHCIRIVSWRFLLISSRLTLFCNYCPCPLSVFILTLISFLGAYLAYMSKASTTEASAFAHMLLFFFGGKLLGFFGPFFGNSHVDVHGVGISELSFSNRLPLQFEGGICSISHRCCNHVLALNFVVHCLLPFIDSNRGLIPVEYGKDHLPRQSFLEVFNGTMCSLVPSCLLN